MRETLRRLEMRAKFCQNNQQIPPDILLSDNLHELCKWLCCFCTEIRKKDGSHYPPKTIHHYLMSIQRHIGEKKIVSVNLMTQSEFLPLKKLLDALYRKLHSVGVGCSAQNTEAITEDDEEQLWAKKILDPDTPQGLLNCFFSQQKKTSVYTVEKNNII